MAAAGQASEVVWGLGARSLLGPTFHLADNTRWAQTELLLVFALMLFLSLFPQQGGVGKQRDLRGDAELE